MKAAIVLLALLGLSISPGEALAEESNGSKHSWVDQLDEGVGIVYDLAVLRPSGFALVVLGVAVVPPGVLLTLPGGLDNVKDMLDTFLLQPVEDTFLQPLGNF